jgi:hypothetical protein
MCARLPAANPRIVGRGTRTATGLHRGQDRPTDCEGRVNPAVAGTTPCVYRVVLTLRDRVPGGPRWGAYFLLRRW